jgi:hypothetical protein
MAAPDDERHHSRPASGDLEMTALLIIVYLTAGPTGANMTVTQFYVPATQVFSSRGACLTALQNVLTQAVANMRVNAVCMDLGQGQQ